MLTYFTFWVAIFANFSGLNALLSDPCLRLYAQNQLYGGDPKPEVTQEIGCWLLCQATPTCKAFEWASSDYNAKCYLFSTSEAPRFSKRPNIDHYVVTCQCNWISYPGKYSYGGKSAPYSSLDKCKRECILDVDCQAIEFDQSKLSPLCFFFNSLEPPTYSAPKIEHMIWKCGSGPRGTTAYPDFSPTILPGCFWSFMENRNTLGGMKKEKATTLEKCQTACIDENNCRYGLDWDGQADPDSRCWISQSYTMFNTPGIRHYTYNCSSGVPRVWQFRPDTNSAGGVVQPSASNLQQCKQLCVSISPCEYGFDWNLRAPLGQQCWISRKGEITNYPYVLHYFLSDKKPDAPAPDVPDCDWRELPDSNSPGGEEQPLYNSLELCQKYCIKATRSKCKGIDWKPAGDFKCWFSKSETVSIGNYPGVSHYSYRCPGETTPMSTIKGFSTQIYMNCGYIEFKDSSSTNGILKPYTDEQTCRNQCTVQYSCKAYEWRELGPQRCWFYNIATLPKFYQNSPGRTYYLFRRCD